MSTTNYKDVNLYQMVDLAVGTPEVGAVNFNVLHTLLHAILRRLNIVDVQSDLNDFDRDSLSISASKARELSVLSHVDSGPVDDAEDALGEKSLESITSFHSNQHLYEEKPIGEMCLNRQPVSGEETNENGIAKCTGTCMSMIEDMTREMQALRDEHKEQMDQIKGLNLDDLMKKLNEMEESMLKFNSLPFPDDNAKFATQPESEDASQGIGQNWENLQQPTERVGIKMSSQTDDGTDPVLSRPTSSQSSRSVTQGASLGPSGALLEILEKLGKFGESHEVLTRRVEKLEAEKKKLDQGASDGLNVSSELLEEQLQESKEQVEALAAAGETISEPSMALELLAPDPAPQPVTSNEDILLQHEKEMHNYHMLAITSLQMKVSILEDRFNLIQDMFNHDSTRWESKHGTKFEEEIRTIFNHDEPDKTRNLAYIVNDQLHDIRDDIITLEEELKKKSKVVESPFVQAKLEPEEIPIERTKSADFKDTDHHAMLKAQNANNYEFKKLLAYCDELQVNKADKTEVDVKADKRSLDNKVNHSLFDLKTNDICQMIKEILDKMAVNEEAWNQQCKIFSEDIDGKLDRLELDPLKEWLLNKLKALNDKLKKRNQAPVEWVDDDAAGIRRQLIQKYNCISCDRPIDIVPTGSVPPSMTSVANHQALPPTRSPRPHLTFEMDQIRQHARRFANADYYATNRSCGGQHTTTYPHKRLAKLSHLSDIITKEDEDTNVYPLFKKVVDVQGADGNIYKGRMDRLEAKLPPVTQTTQDPSSMQRRDKSTQQPMRPKVMREVKPSLVKMLHSPSPPPKNGSRPPSPMPQETISVE